MDSNSKKTRSQTGQSTADLGTTRRTVLAAGGAVALSGLAGCSAIDGLLSRAGEQLIGTTVSAPAAFYPGGASSTGSASRVGTLDLDEDTLFRPTSLSNHEDDYPQVFRTGPSEVRQVPATVRAESREIDLEGWSITGPTKAQDYNSSRSNKPSSEWWVGPDGDIDDDDEDDGDILAAIQGIELDLLCDVMSAQGAVDRREDSQANTALDVVVNATANELTPELDKCGSDVCGTIREHTEQGEQAVRTARDAIDEGDWDTAEQELAALEETVLEDIALLDDALAGPRPARPRFSDIIEYLRGEPTFGERFTVCLPDAKLPGDRGSLAEELTPGRVLSYFAPSHEPEALRTPFNDRYASRGIQYDDEGCIQLDGPVSLHEDISCQNILSAELDTYTTANRGIVGFSTEGGAVVSGAPTTADTDGKCVFVAGDGTLREPDDLDSWGPERSAGAASVTQTLVCPVTVSPADCSCPLPGLFYVRRCTHDDQVIYVGGWLLDEGTLFDYSATLLFDEGPTEIAGVSKEGVESDDLNDRIVEQFSRNRSRFGSVVAAAQVQGTDMNKAELIEEMASQAFQTDQGRKGLNAVNVKVLGEQVDGDDDHPIDVSLTALDAPLVHIDGAAELSDDEKVEYGGGVASLDSETEVIEFKDLSGRVSQR